MRIRKRKAERIRKLTFNKYYSMSFQLKVQADKEIKEEDEDEEKEENDYEEGEGEEEQEVVMHRVNDGNEGQKNVLKNVLQRNQKNSNNNNNNNNDNFTQAEESLRHRLLEPVSTQVRVRSQENVRRVAFGWWVIAWCRLWRMRVAVERLVLRRNRR